MEYLLYKIAYTLVLIMPLKTAYGMGSFLSFFYYHFLRRKEREVLKENLRVVFPAWDERRIRMCARRNFSNFGKFLAEFFYLGKLDYESIKKIVRIEGKDNLSLAQSRGKGVIGLSGHMGNWELGSAAFYHLAGCSMNAIALDHENKKLNNLFISQRAKSCVNVISVAQGPRKIYKALMRGEFVAILADRDVTASGFDVDFFGRRARFPRGAFTLACRMGAPLLPVIVLRGDDGIYTLKILEPIISDSSLSGESAERDLMMKWVAIFEDYVRKCPEQWFMYHRVWSQS